MKYPANTDKKNLVFERKNKSKKQNSTFLSAVWSDDRAALFFSTILSLFRPFFSIVYGEDYRIDRIRAPPIQFENFEFQIESEEILLKYNHSKEKMLFDKRWEKLRVFYKENGMSDEDIEQMYRHDLLEFNSTRCFMEHNCYLDEMTEDDYVKFNSQDEKTIFEKNASRYWWINEIEDETISGVLKGLSVFDIEVITMYAYERFSQREIAEKFGVSQQMVSKRIVFFRKLMANFGKTENP